MVIYSETAKLDLIDTLYGLITWEKHTITIEHAERYVDWLSDQQVHLFPFQRRSPLLPKR